MTASDAVLEYLFEMGRRMMFQEERLENYELCAELKLFTDAIGGHLLGYRQDAQVMANAVLSLSLLFGEYVGCDEHASEMFYLVAGEFIAVEVSPESFAQLIKLHA
jgi:hypothetical protein